MDDVRVYGSSGSARPALDRAARSDRPSPVKLRIPAFPAFAGLATEHQDEIDYWTRRFQPYSDFNFVSLYGWNTRGEFAVSWLGDNLVVLFNDYGTNERFLSFLGVDEVDQAARRLLDYARTHGIVEELRLVPQITAFAAAVNTDLVVRPAPEHQDYILSTEQWTALPGKEFKNVRNAISKLRRRHGAECRVIDLADPRVQQQVDAIFGQWVVDRARAGQQETVNESLAVRRLFSLERPQDLLGVGCFVGDRLVGFSINERLTDGYAMGHYTKATDEFPGAYVMLLECTARTLRAEGYTRLNIQQDLGIPGLASAKQRYRPRGYLRKYRISAAATPRPAVDEPRVVFVDYPPMRESPRLSEIGAG